MPKFETTQVLRIPVDDIVVTRKVPMTANTSNKLRDLQEFFEEQDGVEMPLPIVIDLIINYAHKNILGDTFDEV